LPDVHTGDEPELPFGPEPRQLAAAGERKVGFRDIWQELSKRLVTAFVGGIVAAVVIVGGTAWTAIELWLRSNVVGMVVAELDSDQSQLKNKVRQLVASDILAGQNEISTALDGHLKQTLEVAFSSKVGAVSAGRFTLDAGNTRQVVFLYLPPGYDGYLYVETEGIVPGERIVMNSPQGLSRTFAKNSAFEPIDVASILQSPEDDPQAETIREELPVSQIQGETKHVHALTFRLTHAAQEAEGSRESGSSAGLVSKVDLRFLALVSPPIRKAP
jgi:hypothetical protein